MIKSRIVVTVRNLNLSAIAKAQLLCNGTSFLKGLDIKVTIIPG
jgi:hypothetical protein